MTEYPDWIHKKYEFLVQSNRDNFEELKVVVADYCAARDKGNAEDPGIKKRAKAILMQALRVKRGLAELKVAMISEEIKQLQEKSSTTDMFEGVEIPDTLPDQL